jgi:hypothetical protein
VPYEPHSSGPPSWVQWQRTIRAFWHVQQFLSLARAVAHSHIRWFDDGFMRKEPVQRIGLPDFAWFCYSIPRTKQGTRRDNTPCSSGETEPIEAALGYLQDIGWSRPYCTPDTDASQLPTGLPHPPSDTEPFDWEHTGVGEFPGCNNPECISLEPQESLGISYSPGWDIWTQLHGCWYSRLYQIPFTPFLRLGFAMWDSRRMTALELSGSPRENNVGDGLRLSTYSYFSPYDIWFTWESIVSAPACGTG